MGITERRGREKAHRRRTILEAAKREILNHGLEGATMSGIATAAELSKGALYLYFKSKEELVYALLLNSLEEFRSQLEDAADGKDSGFEKAVAMSQAYNTFYQENTGTYLQLFQYLDYQLYSLTGTNSTAFRCFQIIEEMKELLTSVLQEGQADGSIRKDIDADRSAAMLVHMTESFMQRISARGRFFEEEESYDPLALLQQLFDMILYYLKSN